MAYELVHGPIPEGYEVDHSCRNPSCVNPQHLQALSKEAHELKSLIESSIYGLLAAQEEVRNHVIAFMHLRPEVGPAEIAEVFDLNPCVVSTWRSKFTELPSVAEVRKEMIRGACPVEPVNLRSQ